MARVTVEDCVLKVPNRFELVMVSSQRAREIGAGAQITLPRDNDKNPVVALREIADTDMSIEALRESLIKNHQKVLEVEEEEEDIIDIMEGESEWAAVANQSAESEMEDSGMSEDAGEDVADEAADEDDAAAEPAFDAGADGAGEDDSF